LFAVANRKRDQKQARLDERAQAIRRQAEREARNRNIIIAVFAALILGGSGTLFVLATNPFHWGEPSPATVAKHAGVAIPDEGRDHVDPKSPITYKHNPPSSGPHYNNPPQGPVPWNAYKDALPPGQWVHNLEHGGIVVAYRCAGTAECDAMFKQAFALYSSVPKEAKHNEIKLVTTPYQEMTPKVAVLAWDRELDLASIDAQAVIDFYNTYVDRGPEDVP
jgi:hypothetical protein